MTDMRQLTRISLIAAVYLVLTVTPPLASISYGPVQVRVSEALMVLPAVTGEAVVGLFLGCLAANLVGGLGPVDVVLGSLATLLAGYLVSKVRNPWLVPVPTVLVNALVVGTYLPLILGLPTPLWVSWCYIGAGELVATYGLGLPLLFFLRRHRAALGASEGRGTGQCGWSFQLSARYGGVCPSCASTSWSRTRARLTRPLA